MRKDPVRTMITTYAGLAAEGLSLACPSPRSTACCGGSGCRVWRISTDRGGATTAPFLAQSAAFRAALAQLGARHRVTRPCRPQTNDKAERFIKTLLEEWAYGRLYPTSAARLQTLPTWAAAYTQHRPETAPDGSLPLPALFNEAHANHS